MRSDGSRPCYSAERRRPGDAARGAEARATLANGCGGRPDGAGVCRWASLRSCTALPGECGRRRGAASAGGPAVFMLLRRHLLSRDPLPGVGAGARGGRATGGGCAGAAREQ